MRADVTTVVRVISFALTVAVAVIVVVATKGSFSRLSSMQFRLLWALFAALVIQIGLEYVDFPKDRIGDLGLALLLISYALIFVFCFGNRSVKGMTIITVGIALNVLVIVLNQGMPTKDDVRSRDGHEVHVPIEQTAKHRPASDDDTLQFLGDMITLPRFPNQQFSIGDVVIGLGIIDLCFEGSRRPRRRGGALPPRLSRADRRGARAGRVRPRGPTAPSCRTGTPVPSRAPRARARRVQDDRLTARRTRSRP